MKPFQPFAVCAAAFLTVACGPAPDAPNGGDEHVARQANDGWALSYNGDLNGFFDCLDEAGLALVSAHRGGPAPGFPENALETMQATLAVVPAMLEADVAQSADGVLFLMHDDSLARTTTGDGLAEQASWATLQKLRLEDENGRVTNYAPPKFAEVLSWSKSRTIMQIDFKRSARYEDVIAEIYRQDAEDRVILIAYSIGSAQKLHRLAPDMMISLSIGSQSDLNRAVAAGLPENRLIAFTGLEAPQPRLLRLIDRNGVEGIFGTLGGANSIDSEIARAAQESRYAEIAAMGVDIIATDRPREAHAALTEAKRAPGAGQCGLRRE